MDHRFIFRRLWLLLLTTILCLGILKPSRAQASVLPQAEHSDPYWTVEYWNNGNLSGAPVATSTEANLDHDWGAGAPHAGVNADDFSARWTRVIDVTPGPYRFVAVSDDGIRVTVDDKLIIDEWHEHPKRRYTADVELSDGHHRVVVEYFERAGYAITQLSWSLVPTSSDVWRGEYYDNLEFRGEPFRHDVAAIDFDWGYGSPALSIPGEGFSVRWTRTLNVTAGQYRFTAVSDDGIRVYVDGQRVIDGWYDHPRRRFTADVDLTSGDHDVVVEYYEQTGAAVARFSWEPLSSSNDGWRATYHANTRLGAGCTPPVTNSDCRAIVRHDPVIDFDWGYRAPMPEMPADGFSVRWSRMAKFEPGRYRFTTQTDDGVRLWVDNRLLIDQWYDQALTTHSTTINLEGEVPIRMEYYENGGVASAHLTWSREETTPADGILVDDTDPGFVKGGPASGWGTAAEGYGGHLTWARNKSWLTRWHAPGYNWGRWYPSLTRGRYEVRVYIPDRYTTSAKARYWIKHSGGFTLRVVDQSANGGRWVSLGTYTFNGDGEDRVSLATPTFEADRSRLLAFDAVQWLPQ
jgi:hypothetical protein